MDRRTFWGRLAALAAAPFGAAVAMSPFACSRKAEAEPAQLGGPIKGTHLDTLIVDDPFCGYAEQIGAHAVAVKALPDGRVERVEFWFAPAP